MNNGSIAAVDPFLRFLGIASPLSFPLGGQEPRHKRSASSQGTQPVLGRMAKGEGGCKELRDRRETDCSVWARCSGLPPSSRALQQPLARPCEVLQYFSGQEASIAMPSTLGREAVPNQQTHASLGNSAPANSWLIANALGTLGCYHQIRSSVS